MKTNDGQVHQPIILIIDDNAPLLALYAEILHSDHRILTCSSSQDAAAILAKENVQLVILEPAVSGPYGWEFLKTIAGDYAVPVLVCSALEDRKFGLAAGASAYLVKPVLPETLREAVKSILGLSYQ
jgi:putative two-component system response regulator